MKRIQILRQPLKVMVPNNQETWNHLMDLCHTEGSEFLDWDDAVKVCSSHKNGTGVGFLKYCARMQPPLIAILNVGPEWSVTEVQELTPLNKLEEKIAHLERELEKTYALIGKLTVERGEL